MMESMVRVSGSMPEGWWSAKVPWRLMTASCPPGTCGSAVSVPSAGGVLAGLLGWGLAAGSDGRMQRQVEQEDIVDGGAAFDGVGGVLVGVLRDEAGEQCVGAGGRLGGQRDVAIDEGDGAVGVVGQGQVDGLAGGGDGRGERRLVAVAGEFFAGLLASVQQEQRHQQDGAGEDPEENALVAGIIAPLPPGRPASEMRRLRGLRLRAAMALGPGCAPAHRGRRGRARFGARW